MLKPTLLLLAAAACIAAAPAKAPAPTPAKAPAAAAPKPAAARPAPPATSFDAQDPQGLIGILSDAGARAQTNRKEEDAVFVTVSSNAANFSVQFAGCDKTGRNCQAALFDNLLDRGSPTLVQINGFNQTSVTCRVYLDKVGKTHVLYSAVLLKTDTRRSAETHLAAWQGCIVEGRNFVTDPAGYLANAA